MGARCCASAAVHIAELARIAAATVTARTPARDTPVGLRIEHSRQGRFIGNSYCTASSSPHMTFAWTYGCRRAAFVAYCLFGSILPECREAPQRRAPARLSNPQR